MNTLNFKVLLIKTGMIVFLRAIGIYLLITIPALGVLPMYLVSAMYAVSFGWIAAALFLFVLYLLQQMKMAVEVKNMLLYITVVVAVAAAFQMMEVLGVEDHIWQSGGFILFPVVAVISGWISLAVSNRAISNLFAPVNNGYYETIISSTPPPEDELGLNKVS